MSYYIYTKITITGNADILKDFVYYFENDYDGYGAWYATHDVEGITKEFLNDNCYCIEGEENHFRFETDTLSRKFPSLKFENIEIGEEDTGTFSIYINGKQLDNAEGNSLAFGPHVVEFQKCGLCNASLEWGGWYGGELCVECNDLRIAMTEPLVNSGLMTWSDYFDF